MSQVEANVVYNIKPMLLRCRTQVCCSSCTVHWHVLNDMHIKCAIIGSDGVCYLLVLAHVCANDRQAAVFVFTHLSNGG